MIDRKFIIICLILCFICTLSAVSAADTKVDDANNTLTASDVDAVQQSNDDLSLSSNSNQDVLEAGEGSFNDLYNEIKNGGDVVLTRNYTYQGSGDKIITINKAVNIVGNGNIVINANNAVRIFDIKGVPVGLTNLTFINAKSSGDGGAILTNSKLTIDNCEFRDNVANRGGAIFFSNNGCSNSAITSSRFYGNNATNSDGGALYFGSTVNYVKIFDCEFKKNNAPKATGGAIHVLRGNYFNISNDSFVSNYALRGGAIRTNEENMEYFYLYNLQFIDNHAGREGGAFANNKQVRYFFFENCTFINCSTLERGSVWAGSFYTHSRWSSYKNITIINSSSYMGGAWDMKASIGNIFQDIVIINSSSVQQGGAVRIWGPNSIFANATIINTRTEDPYGNGGAIALVPYETQTANDYCTLDNITIINASTKSASGGAIFWNGAYGTLNNIRIINATSAQDGGAIYLAKSWTHISNSYIVNCTSKNDGGAIYSAYETIYTNVSDTTILNCAAANNGGGVYYAGSNGALIWMFNDTLINNTAKRNGGAVYFVINPINDVPLRDYNNFDGLGIIDSNGRTTVSPKDSLSVYGQRILNTYFENNRDYSLDVTAVPDEYAVMGIITMSNPSDPFKNNYRLVINITKDGELVTQVIYNTSSQYDHDFKNGKFIINIRNNLLKNTTYDVSIGFSDIHYLYKEVKSSFKTKEVDEIGDFHILQRLINEAYATGVLNLPRSFEFTSKEQYGDKIQIPDDYCMNITQSITINGNGFSINALGFSRIFNITGDNVVLNDIRFINGDSGGKYGDGVDKGGAIFWSGQNGVIKESSLLSSHAEYGGGIYLDVGAINNRITNCSFRLDVASKNGGAIDCNAPGMNLTYTLFEQNTADTGAALCRETTATGGFGVYNTFIANHALTNGSALAWISANNININHYTFINNTAGYSGGAIYVGKGSGNCVVNNSYFEGNNVTTSDSGHGGAIEWYAKNGYVLNTTFVSNNAYQGGAIFVGDESSEINILDSNFTNNNAYENGGAMNVEGSNVKVNNARFINNTALEGGAIFVGGHGDKNYVYNSVFEENKAIAGNGGALNWIASSSSIINSNFTRNYANNGGGIYFGEYSSECTIAQSRFKDNHAKYNGGAIDCNSAEMYLSYTTFDSNYAQFGSALCREPNAKGGSGTNNTFINNHAYVSGAALGWMGSVKISITNYTFINNSADISGGAIYISPNSHNCSIISSNFEDNYVTDVTKNWEGEYEWTAWDGTLMHYYTKQTTDSSLINRTVLGNDNTTYYYSDDVNAKLGVGGAINCLAQNATVNRSTFTRNTARLGGAIYLGANGGNTNIGHSQFVSNTAYERGGAIDMLASSADINDTTFKDNKAANGGALFVGGVGTDNRVHNSVFDNNFASQYGAGIYWRASAGKITDSNFTRNCAEYGGGIYLNGISSNSNISNVIFKYNNATKNGGAIDCNSSNMGLYNTLFESNYAGEYGAALARESEATGGHGKNNTFVSNHADISGAALAWLGVENIHIDNYTFKDNTAERSGGAIYVGAGSNNCLIFNSTFEGNHLTNMSDSHFGGAIDCIADNMTVNMSSFHNNGAFSGGAIYVGSTSSQVHILNSNFTSNYASGSNKSNGGAIGLKAHDLTVNESYFKDNTADGCGGAIYVGGRGENNVVYYSVFEENEAKTRGGAIDWLAAAGEIKYSNFTKNSAEYGGGLYLNGESSKSVISHVIFKENTATENGGAIDCDSQEMNLTHTLFTSNYAKYGAALCRESHATGGFGVNNTFDRNHAYVSGAALAWLGVDNIHINNYTFTNNTADYSGAAIYVNAESDNCKVLNSTFKDNYVSNAINGRGGAIDWVGNNGTVAISTFENCISVNGGAIYVDAKSDNMTITNSSFISCDSLTDGGAIAIYGDDVSIADSNFTSCTSKDNGGAIAAFNSNNGNITNCIFKFNSVSGHKDPEGNVYGEGGAIYWENSENLQVSYSHFIANTAFLSGGSVSADNCNNSLIYNITTYDETAFQNGGSISWINSRNVTVEKSYFNDSGADYNGGSIYLSNIDDVHIKNNGINSSWASWSYGGAIYVDGNVTIEDNYINDTHGYENKGTAIYFNSGNSTAINNRFENSINSIYIVKGAEVHLSDNTLTSEVPNNDTTYLKDNSTDAVSLVHYSVWNEGDLYLKNNTFDTVIFNNGDIWTKTTTYVLDNDTIFANWKENFTFWAKIKDDNNNTVIAVNDFDTFNDRYPGHYPMYYNARTLNVTFQGVFHIGGLVGGLHKNEVRNGTLYVKARPELDLSVNQVNEGEKVTITATIPGEEIDLTGNVTFTVGENTYSRKVVGGIAVLELYNLTQGAYEVTAVYPGDMNHFGCENRTIFTVNLRDTWIRIIINNVVYGYKPNAVVTTNGNGTIRLSMNGREEEYDIPTGTTVIPFDTIYDPGIYTMAVLYIQDDYYKYNINSTNFTVFKQNTTLNATPTNITYGENENITVKLNNISSGYIAVNIYGDIHVAKIDNGLLYSAFLV